MTPYHSPGSWLTRRVEFFDQVRQRQPTATASRMTTLSNDGAASSSTAVLGKRKRSVSASLVLHLSGGSSSSSSEADSERPDSFIPSVADSDDEYSEGGVDGHQERPLARRKGGKHAPILVNGKLVAYSSKGRRFACTFQGCAKSYKKPSRLAEHERSHTGEVSGYKAQADTFLTFHYFQRPYKCTSNGCSKSYLRESHLHAHARTHLSVSEKPFICSFGSCSKRYWTAQHLRRHSEVHNGEAPFKVGFAFRSFTCPLNVLYSVTSMAARLVS